MRVLVAWIVALGLVMSPAMAETGGSGDRSKDNSAAAGNNDAAAANGSTAAAPKTETPAKPTASGLENELQQLRDLLESQAKQLQAQSEQLREQQQKMQMLEDRLKAVNAMHDSLGAAPPNGSTVAAAPSSGVITTGVAISTASAVNGAPAQEAKPEEPPALHYKGITLTPGGFMAAESVWRGKALGGDVNTPFNSVPVPGSSQSNLSEFFASGRQSRISMLAEGKLSNVKIGGYYETDFLSAGVTSNNNQSNSYTLRQRQFWAQAAFESGWKFTGGQMWSLVTETKNGLDNRTEAPPMTIDAAYNIGFSWARQYGFRVAKGFGNKFWLGFAVENPQATVTVHGNVTNSLVGTAGVTGGLFNNQANYSFNPAPDFIFKAALQPSWGHFEVFGIVSRFRDRVFPCGGIAATATCPVDGSTGPSAVGVFNDARMGGGAGANARISVFNKHMDLGIHFLGGDGVGRYGASGLPDATLRPDGTLALVHSYQSLGTLEFHYPKLDLYFNVGGEYAARTAYATSATAAVGYGSPLFKNSGCFTEPVPGNANTFVPGTVGSCTADTRNIIEGTFGFWYRFYKGSKGAIQWGPQYSYIVRNTWSGTPASNGVAGPHVAENMVFTSFRYFLP